jgi:hypothetical protein
MTRQKKRQRLPLDHARAWEMFERFRELCDGDGLKEKHEAAIRIFHRSSRGGVQTGALNNFVRRTGGVFENNQEKSHKMFREGMQAIVDVLATKISGLTVDEFVDWAELNKTKQADDETGVEDAPIRLWACSSVRHMNAKLAKLTIHHHHRAPGNALVPLVVSLAVENFEHPIIETDEAESVTIVIAVTSKVEIQPIETGVELVVEQPEAESHGSESKEPRFRFTTLCAVPIRDGNNGWPLLENKICDLRPYGAGPHSLEMIMSCRLDDLKVLSVIRKDGRRNSRKVDFNSKQRYFVDRFVKEQPLLGESVGGRVELARIVFAPEEEG